MNRENVAVVKRKKARGAVLGLLADSYPVGMAYTVLERVLSDANKAQPQDLPGLIQYLEDKHYITVVLPEEPELKPLMGGVVKLSAHGVDLLEESLPEDPGVIF